MMPMTPFAEDLDRVLEGLTYGLPEEGSPAARGGFGAETPEMGEAEFDLLLEGVLDETIAHEVTLLHPTPEP